MEEVATSVMLHHTVRKCTDRRKSASVSNVKSRYMVLLVVLVLVVCTPISVAGRRRRSKESQGIRVGQELSEEDKEELESLLSQAQQARSSGDLEGALSAFDEFLALLPSHPGVVFDRGFVLLRLGRRLEARQSWESAVRLDPTFATGYFNLGTLHAEEGRLQQAVRALKAAISLEPSTASHRKSLAVIRYTMADHEKAVKDYMKCIELDATNADCYCGMGNCFVKLGQISNAQKSYGIATQLAPNNPGFLNNLGNLLVRHNPFNSTALREAVGYLEGATQLLPTYGDAYFNLGNAHSSLKEFNLAAKYMEDAIALAPAKSDYKCNLALNLRKACDWRGFKAYVDEVERRWQSKRSLPSMDKRAEAKPLDGAEYDISSRELGLCPGPLDSLSYPLSPSLYLHIARTHGLEASAHAEPFSLSAPAKLHNTAFSKMRLGYVSIEFRDRPVGRDMAYALQSHDPHDVEVVCFSLFPRAVAGVSSDATLEWDEKISKGCSGGFIDISGRSFSEAAHVINSHALHVLINLDGWTSAPVINELFALRPSPVQVNFKGFAGTTGCSFIHALVGDRYVTPPDHSTYYSEALVILPESYHYNGHEFLYPVESLGETPTRQALGLPEDVVVFANFNQFYKYTPEIFDAWLKILLRVEGSVLWMLRWGDDAIPNLRESAVAAGVDPGRLVFSGFFPAEKHISAKGVADLFLDNRPYCSHGTAADSLYAGVPVLSFVDAAMASRVSHSLSKACGLDHFSARTLEEYIDMAVHIVQAKEVLLEPARYKLLRTRSTGAAFDSLRWVRGHVSAMRLLWETHEYVRRPSVVVTSRKGKTEDMPGSNEASFAVRSTATKTRKAIPSPRKQRTRESALHREEPRPNDAFTVKWS